MSNSRRGAAVALVLLAVVVVYAVYFINVENQKKLGEMLRSSMNQLTFSSDRGGGAAPAPAAAVLAPDMIPVPPLSAFRNVKDNSKLAEFRRDSNYPQLPTKEVMQNMTLRQLGRILLRHLDSADLVCSNQLRMGHIGDGGWEVCDDVRWRPMGDCVVYSFGINHDFSFDDHVAKTYNCHVFSFDPSMKVQAHNRSKLVHFYNWGIGASNVTQKNGWQIYTVQTIRKLLGHSKRPIQVFKMDVEGAEWASIPNMVATGELRDIRQMMVEFHLTGFNQEDLVDKLQMLRDLQQAGFYKFHSHKNPACRRAWGDYPGTITSCYEVYFVNIRSLNKL